jgi:hypothetical protein
MYYELICIREVKLLLLEYQLMYKIFYFRKQD